jgi:pimeloyl-ACP methyl ester carboxylesterase
MRGCGDSEWSPQKDYSVATMGGDILRVLDHAGWKRALLIGHSMGGRSTTWVAAKHPARVAGLALIDYSPENAPAGSRRVTQIVANTPERFSSVDEALKYFKSTNHERFENYLTADFRLKRDTYFRDQFKRLLETGERPKLGVDMWQLLGDIRCPILSMRGSRSDMYAAETVEKMKAANPRLAVVEVEAGHNIAGENPQGFVTALRPFLALLEESHAHERR